MSKNKKQTFTKIATWLPVFNGFYESIFSYPDDINEYLYEDEKLALLSMPLVSFTPIVYSVTRVYMIDFPLMCMTALSVYVLLKTNHLRSNLFSIFTAIIFGISLGLKSSFLLFIMPLFLFYFIPIHPYFSLFIPLIPFVFLIHQFIFFW